MFSRNNNRNVRLDGALVALLLVLSSLASTTLSDQLAVCEMPLSPAYARIVRSTEPPSFIEIEGHKIRASEGIGLAVDILLEPGANSAQLRDVSAAVARCAKFLRGSSDLERIIGLTHRKDLPKDVRLRLFGIISDSDDPRALPFFSQLVQESESKEMRLIAAYALARWNVRSGVSVLLQQFELVPPIPRTGSEVSAQLETMSRLKDWGFPEQEIKADLAQRFAAGQETALWSEYRKSWHNWFEANKGRFPEWKLGDPLPEIERGQEDSVEMNDK